MTNPSLQAQWWTQGGFVLLGVIVGFFVGRIRDWLEGRRTKRLFLKAVRAEMSRIRRHLDGRLTDAMHVKEHIGKEIPEVLHTVTTYQKGIYSSQLSKLRDVFDPLVMEVIAFYDKLSNLERVESTLSSVSIELVTWTGEPQHVLLRGALGTHYASTLDEVTKRIRQLLTDADNLITKLPH